MEDVAELDLEEREAAAGVNLDEATDGGEPLPGDEPRTATKQRAAGQPRRILRRSTPRMMSRPMAAQPAITAATAARPPG
jgi:hypothetical protein